jgi:hypothetical protein
VTTASDLRTWTRRNKAARDAYHDHTKDSRGNEQPLGEHDHGARRFIITDGGVIEGYQVCGCVECSP